MGHVPRRIAREGAGGAAIVNWLHISHLLVGPFGSRFLEPDAVDKVEAVLREFTDKHGPISFVFVTGDLTRAARESEFAVLNRVLETLFQTLESTHSSPALVTVPGNHDFEWTGARWHSPVPITD